jgi:hypothetical protein
MLRILTTLVLATVLPTTALAGQEVRGVVFTPEASRVIDTKCLTCHNRQRIDEAARQQKDMEAIVQRMESKGVSLSSKEKQVLGIFPQKDPLRKK